MRYEPDTPTGPSSKACPIRALHSLRESHAETLEAALGPLRGAWSVERHTDYTGDLSLLLTPGGGDGAGATFVLHRDAAGVQLAAVRGDAYVRLGAAPTVSAAIQRIRRHLSWRGVRAAI